MPGTGRDPVGHPHRPSPTATESGESPTAMVSVSWLVWASIRTIPSLGAVAQIEPSPSANSAIGWWPVSGSPAEGRDRSQGRPVGSRGSGWTPTGCRWRRRWNAASCPTWPRSTPCCRPDRCAMTESWLPHGDPDASVADGDVVGAGTDGDGGDELAVRPLVLPPRSQEVGGDERDSTKTTARRDQQRVSATVGRGAGTTTAAVAGAGGGPAAVATAAVGGAGGGAGSVTRSASGVAAATISLSGTNSSGAAAGSSLRTAPDGRRRWPTPGCCA